MMIFNPQLFWKLFERWRRQKDFIHRCVFRHQLKYCGFTGKINNELVEVLMSSGMIGIYKVQSKRFDYSADDTGQRHYKFYFVGYLNDDSWKIMSKMPYEFDIYKDMPYGQ